MEIFSPPPKQIDEPLCRVFPVINSEDDVLEQILGEKDLFNMTGQKWHAIYLCIFGVKEGHMHCFFFNLRVAYYGCRLC